MNVHAPIISARSIASRAMLGSVRIKQWSGRKLDRKVTEEINRDHGAASDAGRYNKALISRDALAKIVGIANRARDLHYNLTLPWHDDGNRILSSANYLKFTSGMGDLRREFEAAVSEFEGGYSDYVDAARVRLNGMFDAADYPPAAEMARRFQFEIVIQPMPLATDFRVDVSDAEADRIRADIQARTDAAIRAAMGDVFERVCDRVGKLAAKLKESRTTDKGASKAAIFRDSLIENVKELVALLPGLNITADAGLAAVAVRMEKELLNYDADALRDDPQARDTTARAAESILADATAAAAALAHVSDFMA